MAMKWHIIGSLIALSLLIPCGILSTPVSALPTVAVTNLPANSYAVSDNVIDIISVAVFTDYQVEGDWLVVADIDNTKAPYYNVGDVSRYFVVYLYKTDNTTIIAATTLKFWADAPVSIYLAPSVVTGLTYGSAYQLQVIGNYTTPPSDNYTLVTSDWMGSDLRGLDSWVLATATQMNTYYEYTDTDNDLLTKITGVGIVLSNAGGAYFTTAIPNLAVIRPDLFLMAEKQPSYTQKSPTPEPSVDWEAEVGGQIAADAQTFADLFGITGKNFLALGILGALFLLAIMTLTSPGTGFGLVAFAILILLVGTEMGIIARMVTIMIALLCGFIFVRKFWWAST